MQVSILCRSLPSRELLWDEYEIQSQSHRAPRDAVSEILQRFLPPLEVSRRVLGAQISGRNSNGEGGMGDAHDRVAMLR